jgi:MATE family multidrug resistance protein
VRVANQLGAGIPAGAKFSIVVSLASSLIVGIIMSVVILVFRSDLGYLFTNSTSVQHAVANLGILLAFAVVLNSIQRVLVGEFRFPNHNLLKKFSFLFICIGNYF